MRVRKKVVAGSVAVVLLVALMLLLSTSSQNGEPVFVWRKFVLSFIFHHFKAELLELFYITDPR